MLKPVTIYFKAPISITDKEFGEREQAAGVGIAEGAGNTLLVYSTDAGDLTRVINLFGGPDAVSEIVYADAATEEDPIENEDPSI